MSRVEANRRKVPQQKTLITPDHEYYAVVLDTEGDRIVLHSIA
ncbi:MAG: hypothetical protein V1779_05155 [bacterium]